MNFKKIITAAVLLSGLAFGHAQYSEINARLAEIEARKGSGQPVTAEELSGKRFLMIKDFEDHTERQFITMQNAAATFVEVFDDKAAAKTSSNVFTGDVQYTPEGMLSFRFDKLEGRKINLPVAKSLRVYRQRRTLYLLDVNTRERWIDEAAVIRTKQTKK